MFSKKVDIKFTVAARSVFSVSRKLINIDFALEDALCSNKQSVPPLLANDDGYRFISLPVDQFERISEQNPELLFGYPEKYPLHYIDMRLGYDAYLSKFSSKTKSTLFRKIRKFQSKCGGDLDVREYRSPSELTEFFDIASELSAKTYQERLLNFGLPSETKEKDEFLQLAKIDKLRAYLLFADGKAVSYLLLPILRDTIIYAHVGFDPHYRNDSVGTILQLVALERLFKEGKYDYFDFTSGDGVHKKLFGTHAIECLTFIALKPSWKNKMLLTTLEYFNKTISIVSNLFEKMKLRNKVRRLIQH